MPKVDTFVAFDFETTGLNPSIDRVVEIGCVKFDQHFQIVDEWETLVNPKRDVGRSDIHGVTPTMLKEAPVFEEIAESFAVFVNGTILVAHNKGFDLRFLGAEFARLGVDNLDLDALCTMELFRSSFPAGPRQLRQCCEHLGIEIGDTHQALSDARMSARIAIHILSKFGYPAIPNPLELLIDLKTVIRSEPRPRKNVVSESSDGGTFLSSIVQRLSNDQLFGRNAIASAEYLNLLDVALSDGIIDQRESDYLVDLASAHGLTRKEVQALHSSYIFNLCSAAFGDGVLTVSEVLDIQNVANLLGVADWQTVVALVENSEVRQTSLDPLVGSKVCFTGTMSTPRAEIEGLASNRGMIVVGSVSKKVDFLVVADPFSESTKARKAREYGIHIVSERAFLELLGAP